MEVKEFKSVCVIGLGYVGLPTAAILASRGIKVLGVDIDQNTVNLINSGKTHIIEPDLDLLVKDTVENGNFRADIKPAPADAFIVAVPTPFKEGHKPDLCYVKDAIKRLSTIINKGNLIVIESTCPVGTTEQVCQWLATSRNDLTFPHISGDKADVNVSHSPERVLPGKILSELVHNDRVIGGVSNQCAQRTMALYKIAVEGKCLLTNARTAELTKLTENAFRDVNIAFANEISLICDKLDIDPWEAITLANHHPRVNILSPGPGVGGHCIAVDPWFIIDSAPTLTPLIQTARSVNDNKPRVIINKVLEAAKTIRKPTIACFGLTYKSNVADLRESPAVYITLELAKITKHQILLVEPHLKKLPDQFLSYKNIHLVDINEALDRSQLVVLLTDHQSFQNIDRKKLNDKIIIDTRGAWKSWVNF